MIKSAIKIFWGISLFAGFHFSAMGQEIQPTYYGVSEGVASTVVNGVMQDSNGLLWLATESGIQNYDGFRFQTFKHDSKNPNSLLHDLTWHIMEDSEQNLWISTENGISKYDRKTNTFKNYDFTVSAPQVVSVGRTFYVAEDSQKRLWAGTISQGILQYDRRSDKWLSAKFESKYSDEIKRDGINIAFSTDKKWGLCIASSKGIFCCKPGDDIFKRIEFQSDSEIDFNLPENAPTALFVDSRNMLWLTTRNGVYRLNAETKEIKTFFEYDYRTLEIWNYWNCIREDADGDIWISNNYRGMLRFENGGDTFDHVPISGVPVLNGLGFDLILTTFTIDKSGIFWFGTRGKGLMKYDPVEKPFQLYSYQSGAPGTLAGNAIFGIAESKKNPGKIYVGLRGAGLDIFDVQNQEFKHINIDGINDIFGGSARAILEMDNGHVLVGTWGDGIIEFDDQMREIDRLISEGDNPKISSNQIRVLKQDRSGDIWIGSDNGLNIWNRKSNTFRSIENESNRKYDNELTNKVIAILSSPDSLAIQGVGDHANISRKFESLSEMTYLIMNMGEGSSAGNLFDYGWLTNTNGDTIWSAQSGLNSFWAGGAVKNRMFIDAITLPPGTYTAHYFSDESHSAGDGFNESPPKNPEWWGITISPFADQDLYEFVRSKNASVETKNTFLSDAAVMDVEFSNDAAWIATGNGGLNRLDLNSSQVTTYKHDHDTENSLSSNALFDLCIDVNGKIWIGTNNGLDKLDPETGEITSYTREHGLPTNSISTILEGEKGEMWIATSGGLSRMVTSSRLDKVTFINYYADDGTGGDDYIPLVGLRSADGTFFLGGDHGLTSFRSISGNQMPPDIILSNFLISNRSVSDMGEDSPLESTLEFLSEIKLNHDENDLSFEFTALHYANPAKNQYAHKLEGFDADWVYDNRNFASYTNLEPGTYTLKIRASNAFGVWNEEGRSINIIINAPWWRTWWAYAAYVIVFILLIFALDRAMRKRMQLREKEKNRAKELAHAKEIEKAYNELGVAHEDLKSAQLQLIQQEKLASLGQLTAGIAHEIKNPLNFVNNFSDLSIELIDEVREEFNQGEFSGNKSEIEERLVDIKNNLLKISQHGTRADGIVKSMLQHSRGGNGIKEPTDLNALVAEFVNLAFHGMRAAKNPVNVRLDFDFDENLGKADVIADDFSRVVLNLCNNAFDAMREKTQLNPDYHPVLSVKTLRETDTITVSVSDNGSGIPDPIKDKILQPFFTTKKGTDGTGLGLSITHDIIKAHGGTLEIISENQEGSTFFIKLPVNEYHLI